MLRAVLIVSALSATPAFADERSEAARAICMGAISLHSQQSTSLTGATIEIARAHKAAMDYAAARPDDESAAAYASAMEELVETAVPHLSDVTAALGEHLSTINPLCETAASP